MSGNRVNSVERASRLIGAGRPKEAYALCADLLTRAPDEPSLWAMAGRAARAMGQGDTAARALRRATALRPGEAEAHFLLCAVLLERGDPEAQAVLSDLDARFADHGQGWEEVGRVLHRANQSGAALVCFSRALRTAPSFDLAIVCATLLRQAGRLDEAIGALQTAVTLDPRSGRPWFAIGLCQQDLGALTAAAEAYGRALQLDPSLAEAAVNRGTALQDLGRLDEARVAYGEAVRLRPDTFGRVAQALTTSPRGELWLDLARLRRHLGG